MNRRKFIKVSAGYTGYAAFRMILPNVFHTNALARKEDSLMKMDDLSHALERDNTAEADRLLREKFDEGIDAWEIHLLLFPIVQRVLNPPFINPHLPKMDAKSVTAVSRGMIASSDGRKRLGRFLIKSLCDTYKGNYDPHFITGLGSALWVIDRYWNQESVALNALYQYLDFLFDGLRSSD